MSVSFGKGATIFVLALTLWTLYYIQFGQPPTEEETVLFVIGSFFLVLLIGRIIRRNPPTNLR